MKIPKVDEEKFITLKILKGESISYPNTKYFSLKKQVVNGMLIPKHTSIRIPARQCFLNTSSDEVTFKGKYLNPTLRFLFLETLRN